MAQNRPNSHTVIMSSKVDSDHFVDKYHVYTEVDGFIGAVAVDGPGLMGIPWGCRESINIDIEGRGFELQTAVARRLFRPQKPQSRFRATRYAGLG